MLITILDDHPLIRMGIKGAISNAMTDVQVEDFESIGDLIDFSEMHQVDIAITDLSLKEESGFEYIRFLNDKRHSTKCIVYTSSSDYREYKTAMDLGVKAYVRKDSLPEDLMYAISLVKRGRTFIDPFFLENSGTFDYIEQLLTRRELEVLRCISKGYNNTKIADSLYISINTVKKHVGQIFGKLEITDRTELVLLALEYFGG